MTVPELCRDAVERAASLAGKAGPTLGAIEEQTHAAQLAVLPTPGAPLQL